MARIYKFPNTVVASSEGEPVLVAHHDDVEFDTTEALGELEGLFRLESLDSDSLSESHLFAYWDSVGETWCVYYRN